MALLSLFINKLVIYFNSETLVPKKILPNQGRISSLFHPLSATLRSTTELSLALKRRPNRRLEISEFKNVRAERRAFQATMTLKYCQGNARLAERVFAWGRETVRLGLNEHRAGVICQGAQAACCKATVNIGDYSRGGKTRVPLTMTGVVKKNTSRLAS
jgi:hypothetical protein